MDEQSLEQYLTADLTSAGDTSEETSAAETSAAETEQQPDADTADATGEEWRFNSAEWDQLHPELAQYRKQLQGDYTRAQQQLREQQQAVEGFEGADLQWLKRLKEVAVVSPQAAAQMLAEAQAGLVPQAAAPVEEEDFWVTDSERRLAQENRSIAQRLERIEQETQLARVQAEVDRQWQTLEAELGITIPYQERLAHLQAMARENIPYQAVGRMWKAEHGFQHALRRGREEGQKLLREKQGLAPAPSGVQNRSPEVKPQASSLLEHLMQDPALAG